MTLPKTRLKYKNGAGIIIGLTSKKQMKEKHLPKCDTMYFTIIGKYKGKFSPKTTYIAPDELLDFAWLILEMLASNNSIPRIRY